MLSTSSSNPAFTYGKVQQSISQTGRRPSDLMTVDGAVQKTAILLAVSIAGAASTWLQMYSGSSASAMAALSLSKMAGVVALVSALGTFMKPHWAPTTALIFAASKGIALGGLSAMFEIQYPGIVMNAMMLTFGTAATLLVAFQARLITVNDRMRNGIMLVTGGYCFGMLGLWLLSLMGLRMPGLLAGGPVAIGISLVAAGLAAANLLVDFDMIQRSAYQRMPKWFEWYSAFSLMVTLVWMYTEVVRLLAMFARGGQDN